MTTVSILTTAAPHHKEFYARWWQGVESLKRQPDEIILIADAEDTAEIGKSIPNFAKDKTIVIYSESPTVYDRWHLGITKTTSDWICPLGIDDQFLPDGLTAVDETDADLIVDTVVLSDGTEWAANWDTSNRHDRRCAPAAVAPFRRNLLEIWNSIPEDCLWDDFLFYLILMKRETKVYITQYRRMLHDLGEGRVTFSGKNRDQAQARIADEKLAEYRKLFDC
jgi:hypothetical protein